MQPANPNLSPVRSPVSPARGLVTCLSGSAPAAGGGETHKEIAMQTSESDRGIEASFRHAQEREAALVSATAALLRVDREVADLKAQRDELADALEAARSLLQVADLSPLTAQSHPEERPGHLDGVEATIASIDDALRNAGRNVAAA